MLPALTPQTAILAIFDETSNDKIVINHPSPILKLCLYVMREKNPLL